MSGGGSPLRYPVCALLLAVACSGSSEPGGPPAHLWSKNLGQGSAAAVALDRDGNILVAGAAASGMGDEKGPAHSQVLVTKLDPDGGEVWSKRYGGAGIDEALSVVVDGDGNVIVGGAFTSRVIDFEGAPLMNRAGRDVFLVKLSRSGRHLWSTTFGARPEALSLAVDGA